MYYILINSFIIKRSIAIYLLIGDVIIKQENEHLLSMYNVLIDAFIMGWSFAINVLRIDRWLFHRTTDCCLYIDRYCFHPTIKFNLYILMDGFINGRAHSLSNELCGFVNVPSIYSTHNDMVSLFHKMIRITEEWCFLRRNNAFIAAGLQDCIQRYNRQSIFFKNVPTRKQVETDRPIWKTIVW